MFLPCSFSDPLAETAAAGPNLSHAGSPHLHVCDRYISCLKQGGFGSLIPPVFSGHKRFPCFCPAACRSPALSVTEAVYTTDFLYVLFLIIPVRILFPVPVLYNDAVHGCRYSEFGCCITHMPL